MNLKSRMELLAKMLEVDFNEKFKIYSVTTEGKSYLLGEPYYIDADGLCDKRYDVHRNLIGSLVTGRYFIEKYK